MLGKKILMFIWLHMVFRIVQQRAPCMSNMQGDVLLIIVLSVDDMLLIGPNEMHIADFNVESNSVFEMSDLGLLHHYLGIQFKHCDGGIALCQTKYIETLLRRFGLEDCKPIATPMETGLHLSIHDAGD